MRTLRRAIAFGLGITVMVGEGRPSTSFVRLRSRSASADHDDYPASTGHDGIGVALPVPPRQFQRIKCDRPDRCRGTAALEFAIVCGVFLPLAIGIVEVGLVLWTKAALQTAAELAARCGAIKSPDCPNVTDTQQFAVSTAQGWTVSGISDVSNVAVATNGGCNGAPGSFESVTISSTYWTGLPAFFPAASISATACYPLAS